MNTYDVFAPLCPPERVEAPSAWEARKAYAARHRVHVTDVVAMRVNVPEDWKKHLH